MLLCVESGITERYTEKKCKKMKTNGVTARYFHFYKIHVASKPFSDQFFLL